jgi:hypothetical protein
VTLIGELRFAVLCNKKLHVWTQIFVSYSDLNNIWMSIVNLENDWMTFGSFFVPNHVPSGIVHSNLMKLEYATVLKC